LCDKEGNICGFQCGKKEITSRGNKNIDFVDYAAMGRLIIYLSVPSEEFVKSVNIEIKDEKAKINWFNSPYWNPSLSINNLYYTVLDIRANDTLLVDFSKQKNGITVEKQFRIFIKGFQTDTLRIEY
jgi:hypothetical protein